MLYNDVINFPDLHFAQGLNGDASYVWSLVIDGFDKGGYSALIFHLPQRNDHIRPVIGIGCSHVLYHHRHAAVVSNGV